MDEYLIGFDSKKIYVGDIIGHLKYGSLEKCYLLGITNKGYYISNESRYRMLLEDHDEKQYKSQDTWNSVSHYMILLESNTELPERLKKLCNLKQLMNRKNE